MVKLCANIEILGFIYSIACSVHYLTLTVLVANMLSKIYILFHFILIHYKQV